VTGRVREGVTGRVRESERVTERVRERERVTERVRESERVTERGVRGREKISKTRGDSTSVIRERCYVSEPTETKYFKFFIFPTNAHKLY